MYELAFGTGWDRLSSDEALRRMFALGVATALGHPNREEYRRLLEQASSAYDRNVLELSFKEGRQRASDTRDSYESDREVWDDLVDEEVIEAAPPDVDDRRPKGGITEAVVRAPFLELSRDELDRIRLPDLLRRE